MSADTVSPGAIGADCDKQIALLRKELQNAARKLEMGDEFYSNLKKQLREMEDIVQKSRKDFYDVLSGLESFMKTNCLEKESLKVEFETAKQRMERSAQEKSVRREKSMQILNLQSSLEQKTDEINVIEEEVTRLKQVIERKDKHIKNLKRSLEGSQKMLRQELDSNHSLTEELMSTKISLISAISEVVDLTSRTLQLEYEAKKRQHGKDLTKAQENYSPKLKRVEMLQSQLQSQTAISLQVSSSQQANSSVVSPPVISASPLRHPVLPQVDNNVDNYQC